ncbi:MAG: glycosyltransferase family 2 protein, partial [Planctomycetota bacterium]
MADGRTITIPPIDGQDPLVRDWLQERKAVCAWRSFSPMALLAGLVLTLLGGALAHLLLRDPAAAAGDLLPLVTLFLEDPSRFAIGLVAVLVLGLLWEQWLKPSRISAGPEFCAGVAAAAVLYLLFYDFLIAISVVTAVICVTYLLVGLMRILAVLGGRTHQVAPSTATPEQLPVYTVLIPLYREARIAEQIVTHLRSLDYPEEHLDVKILLEADDAETRTAFETIPDLPDWIELLVVPDVQPKTKPRACNHGLARARGEFLVIYDAEDLPDRDQLRKAVAAFAEQPGAVVCLQAHLAFHNHRQNLLTQLFAQEYNAWFQHYLPGLCRFGSPIPLGGTSNHFRTGDLREAGGWDPYNVTEDCDLGLRLAMAGKQVGILDSTTWEEANSRVGNWIRQRSRWFKGYMQTFIVWLRRPGRILLRLGPMSGLWFLTTVGSVALFAVLNPVLWIVLGWYAIALLHDLAIGYGLWDLLVSRPLMDDRWSWPMLYYGPGESPVWSVLSIAFTITVYTKCFSLHI